MEEITAHNSESEIQIVHAIPGRVRLRTTDSRLKSALDSVAQQLLRQQGICEVQTHSTSSSLVVTFDVSKLSLSQLLEILHKWGIGERGLETGDSKLFPSPESAIASTLIPAIAGMAVTGGLGIQGAMSIPVYAIASSVTHELIKEFESKSIMAGVLDKTREESEAIATNGYLELNGNGKLEAEDGEITHSIVHEVPGRIRFRVPRIAKDPEYAKRLTVLTESDGRVTNVRVNTDAASIAISYETGAISDEQMRSHLSSLIQAAKNGSILKNSKASSKEQEQEEERNNWYQLGLPALTTVLSILGGPLGVPIPPAIIGGTIAIATIPVAQRALESILVEHRLNIDFLDLAAITITTLQGQYLNPAIMLLLIEIGETIREQTARSSKRQTLDLLDSLEQFVWVERNGEKQQISIHEVQRGDTVIVYPGDQIPVDGRILRGKALIDEQKLTGEAMPVMRHKGQTVYTSTLVREGQLYIQTEHVGADTRAGQIIKVMESAPVHDTRIENYAAKIADGAVVPTLLVSGIMFGATGNLARAASILTIDFATGIRVSVPTTVLAALTYAARRGILIRSGRTLEKLASVDAVVFDKTGTLTKGEAVIVSVETVSESVSQLRVLELAAAAEQRLTHPVAEAVVRYAQEQGAKILPRGEWDYQIGLGIRAEIDGEMVLVGSDRFMLESGISLDKLNKKGQNLQGGASSIIYVASKGELLGAIAYRDPLRAESREVIKALRGAAGEEIHLLTGDNKRTASAVAKELGIATTHTHAEAFPEQKVAVVKGLHEEGRTVAFVGDGINDSPALAYADVSVSFASGSDVARETADVVLMENNLQGLPEAIAIARQAMELIHQNTGIVAIPNLAALVLAVLVGIDPLVATAVNNGSAIVAGLNGLRPLLTTSKDLELQAANLDTNSNNQKGENLNGQAIDLQKLSVERRVASKERTFDKISLQVSTNAIVESDEEGVLANPSERGEAVNGLPEGNSEWLTAKALANRLKVSTGTISRKKSKPDFPQWARSKDPESIAWTYSKQSRRFWA